MSRHYGQHPICAFCDAEARRTWIEARIADRLRVHEEFQRLRAEEEVLWTAKEAAKRACYVPAGTPNRRAIYAERIAPVVEEFLSAVAPLRQRMAEIRADIRHAVETARAQELGWRP